MTESELDAMREAEIRRSAAIDVPPPKNPDLEHGIPRLSWLADVRCLLRLLDQARKT
jgi:hypothetical protein